jgi:hypothetical protein
MGRSVSVYGVTLRPSRSKGRLLGGLPLEDFCAPLRTCQQVFEQVSEGHWADRESSLARSRTNS